MGFSPLKNVDKLFQSPAGNAHFACIVIFCLHDFFFLFRKNLNDKLLQFLAFLLVTFEDQINQYIAPFIYKCHVIK